MAHRHSTRTHDLDESSATALITLEGLALFCFTEEGGYEGGFLRVDHPHGHEAHPPHKLSLTIDGEDYPLGDGDITIEVVNPVRRGMRRFETGDFDRQTGTDNHPNDFRWIIDAENDEMHGVDLDEANGSKLRRLFLDSGTVYTKSVGEREFVLIRIDRRDERCRFYGRLANLIGVAVACRDEEGSGLNIHVGDRQHIHLPRRPGEPYLIRFKNVRAPHDDSDFPLYYEVMSDPGGVKYDFVLAADPDDPRARGNPCEGRVVKHRDGMGLACDNVFLGETSELPRP